MGISAQELRDASIQDVESWNSLRISLLVLPHPFRNGDPLLLTHQLILVRLMALEDWLHLPERTAPTEVSEGVGNMLANGIHHPEETILCAFKALVRWHWVGVQHGNARDFQQAAAYLAHVLQVKNALDGFCASRRMRFKECQIIWEGHEDSQNVTHKTRTYLVGTKGLF